VKTEREQVKCCEDGEEPGEILWKRRGNRWDFVKTERKKVRFCENGKEAGEIL
jgi:hypothetical protein